MKAGSVLVLVVALLAALCLGSNAAAATGHVARVERAVTTELSQGARALLQAPAPGDDEDDVAGLPPNTDDDGEDDVAPAPGDDEDDVRGLPPNTDDDGEDDGIAPAPVKDDDGADDGADDIAPAPAGVTATGVSDNDGDDGGDGDEDGDDDQAGFKQVSGLAPAAAVVGVATLLAALA